MSLSDDLRKRWVAALRSGDYKQDRGALKSKRGFCCIGVLADILAGDGEKTICVGEESILSDGGDGNLYKGNLSHSLTKKIGLSTAHMNTAMRMNDVFRLEFSEIADFIEKEGW